MFYFSQCTSPSESKFHIFELEFAVVYAIERFRVYYLAGIPIVIVLNSH